jgi:hypothetical protein
MAVLAGCDLNSLITASKCFDCLPATTKQSLQVWFLAQALKSFGGTDLTDITVRNAAVKCIACLPDFRLDSALTAVYQKLASLAGATVDLPIDQLRAKVKCEPCGSPKLERASELYLLCQLALISR